MDTFRYRKHMESVQIHKDIRNFAVMYAEKNKSFPSTGTTADELGLSRSGVRIHLRRLEDEGILKSHGSGSHKKYELAGRLKDATI